MEGAAAGSGIGSGDSPAVVQRQPHRSATEEAEDNSTPGSTNVRNSSIMEEDIDDAVGSTSDASAALVGKDRTRQGGVEVDDDDDTTTCTLGVGGVQFQVATNGWTFLRRRRLPYLDMILGVIRAVLLNRLLAVGMGVVSLVLLLVWQFAIPLSIGMMVPAFLCTYFTVIIGGFQYIFTTPDSERSLPKILSIHRLLFFSTAVFLVAVNVTVAMIGLSKDYDRFYEARHDFPRRYNCDLWCNGGSGFNYGCQELISAYREAVSSSYGIPYPWSLIAITPLAILYTLHYLWTTSSFTLLKANAVIGLSVNTLLYILLARANYSTHKRSIGPLLWFLIPFFVWIVLFVLQYTIVAFTANKQGISFNFLDFKIVAKKRKRTTREVKASEGEKEDTS
jgi:hypothetical protein